MYRGHGNFKKRGHAHGNDMGKKYKYKCKYILLLIFILLLLPFIISLLRYSKRKFKHQKKIHEEFKC